MVDADQADVDPSMAPPSSVWRQRMLMIAPAVVAAGLAMLLWPGSGGDDESPSEVTASDGVPAGVATVDVVATGPVLTTIEELLAAGDVVVIATVAATEPGRAITDPQDPTSGIRTSLFELAVEEVVVGAVEAAEAGTIVVEHETALLDGTPITVNGIAPPIVGQRGLYVLVDGSGSAFPHAALVTADSWGTLDGDRLSAPSGDGADHPLTGRTIGDLRIAANG
ncbi:MAG: hypothetical protein AAFO29_10360 [Actinomycetota bacterium]